VTVAPSTVWEILRAAGINPALGAHSSAEAVDRTRALGLLAPSSRRQ